MFLSLKNVNKSFGENHVLKNLSFEARSGSALGLLGRNGSGKTTTIRIIMDLFPCDSGSILIDGKPNTQFDGKIGYLPEERGLYPKRVIAEQMSYIGELRGMKPQEAKKRSVMLLEKLNAGEYYKRRLDTLSKGNQQKIQLAIALINDPDIVILDEPFSGLDPVNAKILKILVEDLVKDGKMVVFSSHQMNYIEEFCDDICILNKGQIVSAGNLAQIKKSYPRNRVMIAPDSDDGGKLAQVLQATPQLKEIIADIKPVAGGSLITLHKPADKIALFNTVANSGVNIDSFVVVEPSLEEIFIEKAGDENEAV